MTKKLNLAIVLMAWAWALGGFAEGLATISPEARATIRREAFIHQGDGNGLPRNSMEALMRTWERGAIPETDARFTKDGVAISFHDGSWKGRRIADCNWAELKDEPVAAARGAQFASIRIPTIDDVFSAMKGHPDRRIFLDDKDIGPGRLAQMVRRYGIGSQVIYHTNKSLLAREWKSHCPEGKSNIVIGGDVAARIAALAAEDFAGVDRVLIIVQTDFSGPDPFIKPTSDELKKAIAVAHRHGVMVNVFFFGDAGLRRDVYERAVSLGADSLGTERTDAFFAWLDAVQPSGQVSCAKRPIVAIPDYFETNGVVSAKRGMTDAMLKAGYLPVILPEMDDAAADQFLSHCDAVMVGGGIKGQDYARRCAYENRIISLALKRGLPIVGICHGCQIINRYFGGKLAPVPADGKIVHKDVAYFERTGERVEHMITVLPGDSLMAKVFGAGEIKLNSSHTKRCLTAAPGFRVTAKSADGVIEAIEHESLPIAGFQFHPEYYWTKDARCLDLMRRALHGRR